MIGAAMEGGPGIIGANVRSLGNPLQSIPPAGPSGGSGTGVWGTSGSGAGVRGSSSDGSGGEFTSVIGVAKTGRSVSGHGMSGRGDMGIEGIGRTIGAIGHGVGVWDAKIGVNGKGAIVSKAKRLLRVVE